jgi:hypothetical protein
MCLPRIESAARVREMESSCAADGERVRASGGSLVTRRRRRRERLEVVVGVGDRERER